LECEPARREVLIDELCGGDLALKGAVERLLADDLEASEDDFLTTPDPLLEGSTVGPPGFAWITAHLRCPHCHRPTDLGAVPTTGEVLCSFCGTSFRTRDESTLSNDAAVRGRKVGRFELLSTVGSGAFGTVYKARDPRLDRTVALKIPHTEY